MREKRNAFRPNICLINETKRTHEQYRAQKRISGRQERTRVWVRLGFSRYVCMRVRELNLISVCWNSWKIHGQKQPTAAILSVIYTHILLHTSILILSLTDYSLWVSEWMGAVISCLLWLLGSVWDESACYGGDSVKKFLLDGANWNKRTNERMSVEFFFQLIT